MSKTTRRLVLVAPILGLSLLASPAYADDGARSSPREVEAHLSPIPGSGVQGRGEAEVEFDRWGRIREFEVKARGLLPNQPHAAHIHFGAQARHECPTLADDTNKNGHLNTTEGAPAYGPVVLSLTTRGDTSPSSVLAIDRFDTATNGTIRYEREGLFRTSRDVAAAIAAGKGVVVIHGVDYNRDGRYSGKARSDLDPSLPTEATDPALCGVLKND